MKKLILFSLAILLLAGCRKDEEPLILQDTGIVMNYAGADHCSIVIELDNGQNIIPLHYPEEFKFFHGQQLLLTYSEIPNAISTCGKGAGSTIFQVEEIACGPQITEPEPGDYNNMPNDPVLIHQISLEDDCLKVRVAFSGGCKNHTFNLVKVEGDEQEEDTAVLELRHDSDGDFCEAFLTMDIRFNVSSLKEQGYKQFYFKALLLTGETYIELLELE